MTQMNPDEKPKRRYICVLLCHLWIPLAGLILAPLAGFSQSQPGHRLVLEPGTILLSSDSTSGLTLWATRAGRPGYRPSPDFVGWFEPDSVAAWSNYAREFPGRSEEESSPLVARDGGRLALVRVEDTCCAIAFGHPNERQRWIIEAGWRELLSLLDTMSILARSGRLNPPADLSYANPTDRRFTPDRVFGPTPTIRGDSGEIWARMTLDQSGAVIPGSESILWAAGKDLGDAVLRVLAGYRYHRKDAKSQRLVVYQRFRVRGR